LLFYKHYRPQSQSRIFKQEFNNSSRKQMSGSQKLATLLLDFPAKETRKPGEVNPCQGNFYQCRKQLPFASTVRFHRDLTVFILPGFYAVRQAQGTRQIFRVAANVFVDSFAGLFFGKKTVGTSQISVDSYTARVMLPFS